MKTLIVLIEDDEDDQMLFKDAMAEIVGEVECMVYGDGDVALSKLPELDTLPKVVFLDLNLPKVHGLECLKLLKQHPKLRNLPVVIFSTSNNPEDEKSGIELGAHLFIKKQGEYKLYKNEIARGIDAFDLLKK